MTIVAGGPWPKPLLTHDGIMIYCLDPNAKITITVDEPQVATAQTEASGKPSQVNQPEREGSQEAKSDGRD